MIGLLVWWREWSLLHSPFYSTGKGPQHAAVIVSYLKLLPIPALEKDIPGNKNRHDKIVQLVETMLDLHKQLPKARTGHYKTVIQRQITATDRRIDRLVYELYDLTEAEIAVVEESVGNKT